ncbi:MAG TPA: AIM24 family protein [Acidimicrobiales bacterium]|nr:AIM24 family protein [Acidimicrobiales bacterium]
MKAEVKGTTMPVLEMMLDPGEALISTHGELSWMSANMQLTQTLNASGQSGSGGLMAGLKRAIGGGGLMLTKYEAVNGTGMISFAAKVPGRIFPIDIEPSLGYSCHRHGWVCGTPGITPSVGFQQTFTGGLWGGDGFLLQKLDGQGTAYIELSGEITTYDLGPGQTIMAHPGHVGLFQNSVSFTTQRLPGIMNRAFGKDGHHLAVLTGPGKIWLQSMPIPILAHAVGEYIGGGESGRDAAAGGVAGGLLGGVLGRGL